MAESKVSEDESRRIAFDICREIVTSEAKFHHGGMYQELYDSMTFDDFSIGKMMIYDRNPPSKIPVVCIKAHTIEGIQVKDDLLEYISWYSSLDGNKGNAFTFVFDFEDIYNQDFIDESICPPGWFRMNDQQKHVTLFTKNYLEGVALIDMPDGTTTYSASFSLEGDISSMTHKEVHQIIAASARGGECYKERIRVAGWSGHYAFTLQQNGKQGWIPFPNYLVPIYPSVDKNVEIRNGTVYNKCIAGRMIVMLKADVLKAEENVIVPAPDGAVVNYALEPSSKKIRVKIEEEA